MTPTLAKTPSPAKAPNGSLFLRSLRLGETPVPRTHGIVMAVVCHYCTKPRHPREILRIGGYVKMCWHCYEWHAKAIAMISGTPPEGCQTCHLTYAELEAIHGANVRFVAVPKDGIYQVQCGACADTYIPQRRDLVKDTPYAQAMRLF